MTGTLRLLGVLIQPVLVWDSDGELTPGPAVQPATLPLSKVPDWVAGVPGMLDELQTMHSTPAVCQFCAQAGVTRPEGHAEACAAETPPKKSARRKTATTKASAR